MPQIHNQANVLEMCEVNNRVKEKQIICLQYAATSKNIGGTVSLTICH